MKKPYLWLSIALMLCMPAYLSSCKATHVPVLTSDEPPRYKYRDIVILPKRAFDEDSTVEVFYDRGLAAAALECKGGRRWITADRNGVLGIPVSKDLWDENPGVHVFLPTDYRGGKDKRPGQSGRSYMVYTICYNSESLPFRSVSVKDLNRLAGVGYVVFYENGCRAAAEKAFEQMPQFRSLIKDTCGIEPVQIGIAIVKNAANYYTPSLDTDYSVWTFYEGRILDPKNVDPPYDGSMTHEWTEHSLLDAFADKAGGITWFALDDRLRFIHDGIAEYVASLASDRHLASSRDFLELKAMQGTETCNLLDKSWDGVDYKMSLFFWRSLAKTYGEDTIRRFLQGWQESEKQDLASAIKCLESITGNPCIREQLEAAQVKDALEFARQPAE